MASLLLVHPGMKTTRNAAPGRRSRKIATTLGDLIAAAYGAAGGMGPERQERAVALLTESPLARRFDRRLEFVR
jgi:hypothetical protein